MTADRQIWWVRHGPTHQKTFCGWRDVPADLSDVAALARLSAGLPARAALVSSDLGRAVRTADAIVGQRPRLPHHRDLREFDFGAWDGQTFDAVAQTDPALSRAFWETPGDVAPPGGESWHKLAARVETAIAQLLPAAPAEGLIVVAHIGVILTQVARARGHTPAQALAQNIRPLSASRLTYGASGRRAHQVDHIF